MMRILKQLFIVTLFVCKIACSEAMELVIDPLESFTIKIENETFIFREVKLDNLGERDYKNYIEATGDFGAIQQMFGTLIGCVFKGAHYFYSSLAHEAIIEVRKKLASQNPHYSCRDWFVEEETSGHFVGHIALFTPQIEVPKEVVDHTKISDINFLEVGASLTEGYRGRGLGTKLTFQYLQRLERIEGYQDKGLLLYTLPDNVSVHKIAEKMHFKHCVRMNKPFDFGLFNYPMDFDVFARKITDISDQSH